LLLKVKEPPFKAPAGKTVSKRSSRLPPFYIRISTQEHAGALTPRLKFYAPENPLALLF
jgi:hypothetical protein